MIKTTNKRLKASRNCDNYQIQYWYHPDYLGHTELVSDANGDQYEFHWYAPFGETIKSAKANTAAFSSPYLFNAKEYDSETGNYYYGARYYNPELSVWLSVDPLAHKYPSLSSYNFVAGNPIMSIDPDGRQIDPASQVDWDQHKQNITEKAGLLLAVFAVSGNSEALGRASVLNSTLAGMEKLEDPSNTQVYSIDNSDCTTCVTRMDKSGNVVIPTNGGSTGNFAHEVTHGIQFEENKVAFFQGTDKALSSLQNEVEAYSAELAYNGSLGNRINPSKPNVTTLNQISKGYVRGIVDDEGRQIYRINALMSIGPDLNYNRVNGAYPWLSENDKARPGETLRSMYDAKWRR